MASALFALSRQTLLTLCLLPLLAPTAFLLVLKALVAPHVACTEGARRTPIKNSHGRGRRSTGPASTGSIPFAPPSALPRDVRDDDATYVLSCERIVSRAVATSRITVVEDNDTDKAAAAAADNKSSPLLTAYLRATMSTWSWTPQAFALRSLVTDPAVRRTFDGDYLAGLAFQPGERANGVYQVTRRGPATVGDRTVDGRMVDRTDDDNVIDHVELSVLPLPDHPEMVVHAIVVAEVRRTAAAAVVFVNETWMWRRVPDEKPTLLEGAGGRWLHVLLAGWLMTKGIWRVTAR